MAAAPPLPLDASYFVVAFPGLTAKFSSVSGLDQSIHVIDSYTTDAQGQSVRQRTASTPQYSNVSCTSGATSDLSLDKWISAVIDKGVEGNTKDGTVTLFNAANTAVGTWNLTQAVITSLQVDSIGVSSSNHLDYNANFDVMKIERTK